MVVEELVEEVVGILVQQDCNISAVVDGFHSRVEVEVEFVV